MTSPGDASVVPIALVCNGRTGYTLWAAPWLEDGDEWQAFLGAGSTVFVFDELDDLAEFLGSGAENDLSDHPLWTVLQTLPAAQLTPETDYVFDLDEVPELTEHDPDEDVVMRVGDTIDMVRRIAECCDNGSLLHLLETPAFAALLDEEADFDDEDDEDDEDDDEEWEEVDDEQDEDNPWAEIGHAVRTSWPLVVSRMGQCLRWFGAGEQPERVTTPETSAATGVGAVGGVADASVTAQAGAVEPDEPAASEDTAG